MNEVFTAIQFRRGEEEIEKAIAIKEEVATIAEDYIQGLGTLDDDMIIPECFERPEFWPAVLEAAAYGQTLKLKEILLDVARIKAEKAIEGE